MTQLLNLGDAVTANACRFKDKPAVLFENRQITYGELDQRTNRLGNLLTGLGLQKRDHVAIFMDNCTESAEVYIAAAKTGLVVVPINFRLSEKEIAGQLNHSESKCLIFDSVFTPIVENLLQMGVCIPKERCLAIGAGETDDFKDYHDLVAHALDHTIATAVDPEDTWILLYTSGTTGHPKGVIRSHRSYLNFFLFGAVDFGFTEQDISLTVMPMFHANSTFFAFTFIYIGATVVLQPSRNFDPQVFFRNIEKFRISFVSLIPTHYKRILKTSPRPTDNYDISSLKKLLCSSADAGSALKQAIMDRFPTVGLFEAYGSSEAGTITILKPHEQRAKIESIGRPAFGISQIQLLDDDLKSAKNGDVGELFVKGTMAFDGYYKQPDITRKAFVENGFTSGDLAWRDDDGFYYLAGRKDDKIITGGEHVYPREVEEVINCHPSVEMNGVIGIKDPDWGRMVVALVVPKPGAELTEPELIEFCKARMASYKKPKKVIFITADDMPTTASGKISHKKLSEQVISETSITG
nr:AMP-binding protein [uncultured Desulfobacter sp.]